MSSVSVVKAILQFGVVLITLGLVQSADAQNSSLGAFEGQSNVGSADGSATYDEVAQEYVVRETGGDRDGAHFVWRQMRGNFVLRARAQFRNSASQTDRSLGWMVRSSLADTAAVLEAVLRGEGRPSLQFRGATGDRSELGRPSVEGPDVLELKRDGDTFTLSVAQFGDPFTRATASEIDLGEEVYVGLFVSSHEEGTSAKALFHNVRVVKPAPDSLEPYEDYLGSNLETMNVETGRRTIQHRSSGSLQAPNWTPDGHALIYNSGGLLYRFDLETKTPEVIDTGFADENNNDHVISFDGTRLGISHHAEAHDGASIIYAVPIEGGTPTQVTSKGPSYLHGWSPDDRYLVYTGERGGEYDLYKIPVEGGEELRLTSAPGLDDGSEYTPDGEYVYFNSVRSGSMELWRMRPDGNHPEQLTDDRLNNWFPHVSPDGETVVFLSYPASVPPGDHPFYKHVYLRKMPVDGGTPEVIAYLYGGQGTINVPSWSPDSKRIGFVSNTGTN